VLVQLSLYAPLATLNSRGSDAFMRSRRTGALIPFPNPDRTSDTCALYGRRLVPSNPLFDATTTAGNSAIRTLREDAEPFNGRSTAATRGPRARLPLEAQGRYALPRSLRTAEHHRGNPGPCSPTAQPRSNAKRRFTTDADSRLPDVTSTAQRRIVELVWRTSFRRKHMAIHPAACFDRGLGQRGRIAEPAVRPPFTLGVVVLITPGRTPPQCAVRSTT
jgi:hypothetical protein